MANHPTRIAVLGASGRMGRLVIAQVLQHPNATLCAAVVREGSSSRGIDAGTLAGLPPAECPITPLGPGCFANADVVIDFSLPAGLVAALPHLGDCALVSGTTGLTDAQRLLLAAQTKHKAILRADNFSTGVTVLRDLVARASAALRDYDIEIVEAHHRHKRDAPSGTALALGESAATGRGLVLSDVMAHGRHGNTGERPVDQIAMHAVRGGGIVGDHTIMLCGSAERIELRHSAGTRSVFAEGALRAALWMRAKPAGAYHMEQVLGLA